jgi:hypothetical protein
LSDSRLRTLQGLDKPAPSASPGDRSVLFSDPLEIPRTPPGGIAGGATAKGAAAAGKAFDSVNHGARGGAFGAAEGGGDEGVLSGEGAASGGSTSKKVEIETSEYQRLKALVEPVNGSVKVLGDKVLLDRVEFDRLTAEAEKVGYFLTSCPLPASSLFFSMCVLVLGSGQGSTPLCVLDLRYEIPDNALQHPNVLQSHITS